MTAARNSGSLRLSVTADDAAPVSPVFSRASRRTQTVRYRRRSRRQGPSISQLVPVLLEGTRRGRGALSYEMSTTRAIAQRFMKIL